MGIHFDLFWLEVGTAIMSVPALFFLIKNDMERDDL